MRRKRFTQELPKLKNQPPPVYHVFVDTESNWSQIDGKTPIIKHTLRFGYAEFAVWDGKFLRIDSTCVFHNRGDFWKWLTDLGTRTRCWVWAHNLAFDGTLLDLWSRLQEDDCQLMYFTDTNLPSFFECNIRGKSYKFLDSLNVFRTSLLKIGQELGLPKMKMPLQEAGMDEWLPYCKRDVEVLRLIIEKWIQFITTHKLGKLSVSLAGQALVSYRTRFMQHPIHLHCNEGVTRLERDAYIGGLTDPKFIGKVPDSPIYEYDINSLYPFIMKTKKFPNLLMGQERWPSDARFNKMMKDAYVIAHVKLKTTVKVFPCRYNGRLLYPYGEYWTCLHKPELERAMSLGIVDCVGFMAWYTEANLFKEFVDFFYGLRKGYSRKEDGTFNYMCKILMNSLYGKFGQRQSQWDTYSPELVEELELKGGLMPGDLSVLKEHIEDHESGELKFKHPYNNVTYGARRLLSVEQLLTGDGESAWSFPAIAGAVTSYAREHVRNIQEMIGKRNLFYTDTDSFFVNKKGKGNLERLGMLCDVTLGKMKRNTENEWMTIYGPKDYETNNELKRKGIRSHVKPDASGGYTQEQWPSFRSLRKQGFPTEVSVQLITKHLKRVLLTMRVNEQGWTIPLLIKADNYSKY